MGRTGAPEAPCVAPPARADALHLHAEKRGLAMARAVWLLSPRSWARVGLFSTRDSPSRPGRTPRGVWVVGKQAQRTRCGARAARTRVPRTGVPLRRGLSGLPPPPPPPVSRRTGDVAAWATCASARSANIAPTLCRLKVRCAAELPSSAKIQARRQQKVQSDGN